ncbi:MAG: hypothetical protein HYZ29_10485 [Myxococcales bacterium]|nr:hypothetical protein [Myxococcales bacterium]
MRRRLTSLACSFWLFGCGNDELAPTPGSGDAPWVPPPESCEAPNLDDPRALRECSLGSGVFGRWVLDPQGLPAYDYRLDQHADARAAYPVSERDPEGDALDRRDHWAAFGNRRVNAHVFNDGMIELVTQDRGVEYLNKLDESKQAFAGGFGWLSDGDERWCTAYKWRPKAARTTRRFGMGYAESSIEHRDVRATRVTAAAKGNVAAIVSDVTLENLGSETKTLTHWEYWDVFRRPIEINWIVSGESFALAPSMARDARDARNAWFDEEASFDPAHGRLELRRSYVGDDPRPKIDDPRAADYYANSPFLAAPLGGISDVLVDQAAFFGAGPVAAPDGVLFDVAGTGLEPFSRSPASGAGQPHVFVMKSDVVLPPGASQRLRFVYGYAREGEEFPDAPSWHDPSFSAREQQAEELSSRLMYFAEPSAPELSRELAWHAYQLEASVGHRDYWQGPVVPQGSAYLYLHGADGAARDLGLFALPLVYTDPALARAELRLYMGIQFSDERFSYAFQGHGMLDDAGIHSAPSDLPLFFLWALGEYLGATGDLAFLDEKAPYWPRGARPNATVWDHTAGALKHLFEGVGTGEHGLIRIGTGDWSDGIVMEAPDRELAVAKGESVPNTQMAVAVLPRIADLIDGRAPDLAKDIRARVEAYRLALEKAHNGKFFYRCYFGDGKPRYDQTINLEAQIWALIGGTFDAALSRAELTQNVAQALDDPSPIGATLTPGGQVWPAISAPLTWGYARSDPARAWKHFTRNTMAAHARAFPEVWSGIWSGPDGVSSESGWAWKSQVTPMTDFPVQNNNAHAMPLFAALKIAGVEASAQGLVISPRVPSRSFSLETAVIELSQRGASLTGRYRPSGKSARQLVLEAPEGEQVKRARVNGKDLDVPSGATSVTASTDPEQSGALEFELLTEPKP